MAAANFDQLKAKLDAACASLRSFTLGQGRMPRKRGLQAIKLVGDLCDQLSKLPRTPFGEPNPVGLIAVGRSRIKAAEARLALLQKLR